MNKIKIRKLDENYMVWNASDIIELRNKHRIVGSLIGCLPRIPRQNQQLGRPLLLLREEAALLIKRDICQVLKEISEPTNPDDKEIEEFKIKRDQLYHEQNILAKEDRLKELEKLRPRIYEGMKRKAKKDSNISSEKLEENVNEKMKNLEKRIDNLPESAQMLQIPTACTRLIEAPEEINTVAITDKLDETKIRVFEDLHDRGYFLTNGSKFGGDFLVYPGDPCRYHSHYVVICLENHAKISPQQFSTYSRLATIVKKTILLSYLKDDYTVHYISLNWAGIS
ncbi:DgyrCDS5228 [Dimorphilus gyrociliatus]|uniref:tRNA-splicing endonuclease subunit Sen34 n=1 Tax=Dimorphilus gyrociliatus TaxID=2664684 RepID=A0A7I8VJC6_9ANNE|nr:DgyrCDS5228 [Dimorphilus gyrociliatus]